MSIETTDIFKDPGLKFKLCVNDDERGGGKKYIRNQCQPRDKSQYFKLCFIRF